MDMSLGTRQELAMDRETCSPWCRKQSDMTERLNWTEQMLSSFISSGFSNLVLLDCNFQLIKIVEFIERKKEYIANILFSFHYLVDL